MNHDWSIEDDEEYTVYNVKQMKMSVQVSYCWVLQNQQHHNASLFEESDFIVTRMLDYEKRYVSALADNASYEHLLENAARYRSSMITTESWFQGEDRLESY